VLSLAVVVAATTGSLIGLSAGQRVDGTAEAATGGRPTAALRSVALVVDNPSDQHSTVGTPVRLHIAVSGAFGVQALRAVGLPAGTAIDPITGVISGSPTDAGTTRVTVTATDADGDFGTTSFTWSVDAPVTVSLVRPNDQHGMVGTIVHLALSAHASDQATITYQASPLPAGLSIDTATGHISGSPTSPGTWTVTVTATSASATTTATFHWSVGPRPVHSSTPSTPQAPPTTRSRPFPPPSTGNHPPGCPGDHDPWGWDGW